jgi:DNA-binding beta-propeller fold protein YncE
MKKDHDTVLQNAKSLGIRFRFFLCLLINLSLVHAQDSLESPPYIGSFNNASVFCLDPMDNIFVIEGENHTLLKLSSTGDSLAQIGGYGWAQIAFEQAVDIIAPNGLDVYVTDYGNHRIQRFDHNLNFISSLSMRDDDNMNRRFGYPRSAALSRQGALFIVDGENTRILKVFNDRKVERIFAGLDAGSGRLHSPTRVRVDNSDRVYVQDENHLVVFDVFGNYIRTIGSGLFLQMRTFTVNSNQLYILDSCSVFVLKADGTVENRIEISLAEESTHNCAVVDLAVQDNRLFLLTRHHIYVRNLKRE